MKRFAIISLIILSSCCPESGKWAEILHNYKFDKEVGSVLLVKYEGGSNAEVILYTKGLTGWKKQLQNDGHVGLNGIGKTREGDKRTPEGDFSILDAFGILPNPGTGLNYIDITPSIFACDEDTEYYNQIIDTSLVHHDCKGEDMYHISPGYNYGIVIDYNPDDVYPLGSNIFLHCKSKKTSTSGCVAVDEEIMVEILRMADPGMRICIHPKD